MQQNRATHQDWRRSGASASSFCQSGALLLHVTLVAVALEHGFAHGATALPTTPHVLKTSLRCMSGLDHCWSCFCMKNTTQTEITLTLLCVCHKYLLASGALIINMPNVFCVRQKLVLRH